MERKSYESNYKAEAVKLARESSVRRAAQKLGISEYTLRNWVEAAKIRPDNPFIGSGRKYVPSEEAEKIALRKENQELKHANEILKEALSFFVKSQKK